MKTVNKLFVILSAILLNGSCTSNTSKPETTIQQAEIPMENDYISGRVQEIQQGKDGYTAKIITADSLIYFATVSHANLKENVDQYRKVETGETITVKGDTWKMGDETHITVRALK